MEKLDLRNEFISQLKKGSNINIPEEYTLLRNQNYCEWLENRLLEEKNYCMPDNINSKEEHLQYLKDIGLVKKLQHHYDTTIGLYAIDFNPKELIKRFVDSQSDATRLLVEDVEELIEDWEKFLNDANIGKSPFFQIK